MVNDRRLAVHLLATGGLAVALAAGLSVVVDSVVVWGGYQCETTGAIHACTGYPPVGLFVAIAVATVATDLARQGMVAVTRGR